MLHRTVVMVVMLLLSDSERPGVVPPARSDRSVLSHYNLSDKKPPTLRLPRALSEVSGVVETGPGRLLAHNDELGELFEIDASAGTVISHFFVGDPVLRMDFEDITRVGEKFFLVTSKGNLIEFSAGANGTHVPYQKYTTKLKKINNVEGVCYDPETESLLLACKDDPGKGNAGNRAVFSYSLVEKKLADRPRFLISLDALKQRFGMTAFQPSAIVRDAKSGSFLILSAHERAIVELSAAGEIVACARLPMDLHRQPEAMALTRDAKILIGNEDMDHGVVMTYSPKE